LGAFDPKCTAADVYVGYAGEQEVADRFVCVVDTALSPALASELSSESALLRISSHSGNEGLKSFIRALLHGHQLCALGASGDWDDCQYLHRH
jgi:hypothetical protein